MGIKLDQLRESSNLLHETGNQNLDQQEPTLEEAAEAKSSIMSMNLVDDDLMEAANACRNECAAVAENAAANEIEAPTNEVRSQMSEVSAEATQLGDTTDADARMTDGIDGHFGAAGNELRSSLEAGAREFHSTAEVTEQHSERIGTRASSMASKLRSEFP